MKTILQNDVEWLDNTDIINNESLNSSETLCSRCMRMIETLKSVSL